MRPNSTVIAVFKTHDLAEEGVKRLATAGFDIRNLTIVGKGYHTEEQVVGFYNNGDRISFWGKRGAYWGALWGLFFGGVMLSVPPIGSVVVLGHLAAAVVSALEGAVVIGGASALAAALFGIGVPKDSVVEYEAALKADEFLVMAHGAAEDVARARGVLAAAAPARIDVHQGNAPTGVLATAVG